MISPAKLPELSEALIRHLEDHHAGEDNAATAAHLVEIHELSSDRDLRDIVRHARLIRREPVISTYSGHYSWPTGPDDDAADHCIRQRREVAADNFAVASAIEDGMRRRFPADPIQLTFEGAA